MKCIQKKKISWQNEARPLPISGKVMAPQGEDSRVIWNLEPLMYYYLFVF